MKPTDAKACPEETLDRFLERIEPRLRGLIVRYGVPPQDAEDILQQSFLAFVQKQHSIRNPGTWLVGTVRKQCLMYFRASRRRLYHAVDASVLELIAPAEKPSQEQTELVCDLDAAIARIPARCRSLLRLRYRLGYEPAEVAAAMGYRSSSIRKVTTRCLAALTRQLFMAGPYEIPSAADADQGANPAPSTLRRSSG